MNVKLLDYLNRLVGDKVEQQRFIAYAVALHKAAKLALPSSEVEDINAYYLGVHKLEVNEYLSYFNEQVTFDYNLAGDLIRNIFITRYQAAFVKNSSTLMHVLVNPFSTVSQETIEYINTNKFKLDELTIYLDNYC